MEKNFFFLTKLINIIILAIFYIPAFILVIFIRVISPYILIRFGQLSRRVGHFTANAELILCERKTKFFSHVKKKEFDIFCIAKVPNKQIIKMYKRAGIRLYPYYLIHPIIQLNKILPGGKKFNFENSKFTQSDRDFDHLFEKIDTQIKFTKEELSKGEKLLKTIGINRSDKIVCLLIRDNNYLTKYIGGDWKYHNYRNYNIKNFYPAINQLLENNYTVFRMGKYVKEKININHPKFVDYPFTKQRSDFLDVYISSICKFCVTTASGFDAIPYVFRKPLAFLHVPVGIFWTFSSKYFTITKHHYSKALKRNLTLEEIFQNNLAYALKNSDFSDKKVKLIDNSPEEIVNLVTEMINFVENKNSNKKDYIVQEIFKSRYGDLVKKYPHKRLKHGKILSNISAYFINQNNNWLN